MKRTILLAFATTLIFAQAPPPRKPLAPPAKTAPATAATPIAGGFVANKSSKVLHKADCTSVGKMQDKNKVAFASKDEAVKAGYKPCKACKP
jgi:hypothetical protein